MTFQSATEVQDAVTKAPKGAQIEVARHGVAVIQASANAYKRGFAMSVRMPDGSVYNVAGCVRARDVSIDVMVAKARRYVDDFLVTA